MRVFPLILLAACALAAAPPKAESIFPVSGRAGTTFPAQIRTTDAQGAYAIWFESPGATAEILKAEPDPPRKNGQILHLTLRLADSFEQTTLRVVTPTGVSTPLRLLRHPEPTVLEAPSPKDLPTQAQLLPALPAAVQGRIGESGEVDYYRFHAQAGETWTFETISSRGLDPALSLYRPGGSWFDPDRPTRIAFRDEAVSYPDLPIEAALRHRFDKTGDYYVRVNGFWGHGGPGQEYTLRIHRGEPSIPTKAPAQSDDWAERTWTRPLGPDRMERLAARALPAKQTPIPVIDADAEPQTVPVQPPKIPLPALVVGSIERPGDIDRARFTAKEGDRLAFEIETPEKTLPHLNPYLRIIDSDGVEAFTNILSTVNSNGNASKQIKPKTVFSFPRGGEFTLEIRDITASYGDPGMRYRLLVRPQVPHLGEVTITADALNLDRGKTAKLSVVTDQEEGFEGFVVLSIDGLPPGVTAVTGTEVEPDSPPQESQAKRERFVTKNKKATILLMTRADAPLTRLPAEGRVYAQPVVNGTLGEKILIKKIPIMVIGGVQ